MVEYFYVGSTTGLWSAVGRKKKWKGSVLSSSQISAHSVIIWYTWQWSSSYSAPTEARIHFQFLPSTDNRRPFKLLHHCQQLNACNSCNIAFHLIIWQDASRSLLPEITQCVCIKRQPISAQSADWRDGGEALSLIHVLFRSSSTSLGTPLQLVIRKLNLFQRLINHPRVIPDP